MKVLVCGGRDFDDASLMTKTLDEVHDVYRIDAIIHGDAKGADRMAGGWARQRGFCEIKVPANWNVYGKSAGPVRNDWMAKLCDPDLVIAFLGGKGTAHMIQRARDNNIKVMEVKS